MSSLLNILRLLLLLLFFTSCNSQLNVNTVVTTSYGNIRGNLITINNQRSIVAFRGIPYAEPPTRGNRFRDPRPLLRWTTEVVANKEIHCPQVFQRFKIDERINEDEDCLYLNIFYPVAANNNLMNLPVLVYFHGGEFKYGGKDHYQPDILLRERDLVLVTVNYRLGALGFLSTNDSRIPGNFGLKDQLLALDWIQNEIHNFKGDKNRITIFGHDAGSISVDIHRLLHPSLVRYNSTISTGGTVFTAWAFQEEAYENAYYFARNLSCSTSTNEKILNCLQEKSLNEILSTEQKFKFSFRPIVDVNNFNPLIAKDPLYLYKNRYNNVRNSNERHLFGLCNSEGALDYYLRYDEIQAMTQNDEQTMRSKIKKLLEPYSSNRFTNKDVIAALIYYKYFEEKKVFDRQLNAQEVDKIFVDILGNYLYNSPTDRSLRLLRQKSSSASLYVFQFKGQKTFGTKQIRASSSIARDAYDVTHMDDIFYIFKTNFDRTEENAIYSSGIVQCLYNFMIASPDRTCQKDYVIGDGINTIYDVIDGPNVALRNNFKTNDEFKFWNQLIVEVERLTSTRLPYFDQAGYDNFRAATWTLMSIVIIIIIAIICFVIFSMLKKQKEKQSLQFLKKRDKELEERSVTENL